jgi:hypothetical protein
LCLECRPLTLFVHLLICRYANIRKRPLSPQTPKKSKRGRYSIMKDINCKTTVELTPRKKKKKFLNIKQKIQICKLKNSLIKSKNGSQFKNCKRKINSWTPADKGFALTLYKRGPRCYRFLSKILKLPSKSTLQKNLRNIGEYLFISWTYCPK